MMGMRLIDADKIIDSLGISDIDFAIGAVIDEQPTAFNVDKVVEQLEEERENVGFVKATTEASAYIRGINDAIEIVKGGGVDGN
jgi:hypothetical protein